MHRQFSIINVTCLRRHEKRRCAHVTKALLALTAALIMSGAAQGADTMTLEVSDDGALTARAADRAILWRVSNMGSKPQSIDVDSRGRIVLDGTLVIDRQGSIVARQRSDAAYNPKRKLPSAISAWDVPTEIGTGPPLSYSASVVPLIDSSGNVWVILPGFEGDDQFIQVTRSEDAGVSWTPPETILRSKNFVAAVRTVIDSLDRITIAYRELDNMNHVRVIRYVPGKGWSLPKTLYSTEDFFQQVDVAVDNQDNVVVSFDPESTDSMFALVFDSASEIWSDPVRVSPAAADEIAFPTLLQNRAGTRIYAAYWLRTGPAPGIYLRRFLSPALSWARPQRVPGTYLGGLPGGTGPSSFIPATVDDAGNVTVPFYLSFPLTLQNDTLWVLRAARLEAGVWTAPVTVMVHRDFEPLLVNFADADYSANGNVSIVFKRTNDQPRRTVVMAFTYDVAAGLWNPPAAIHWDQGSEQRTRTAFRSDGSALATYRDANTNLLSSRLFELVWSTETHDIPNTVSISSHETIANDLDVLMIYDDFADVFATWFRNSQIETGFH